MGQLYAQEFLMKEHRNRLISWLGLVEGGTAMCFILYCWLVSKWWQPWYVVQACVTVLAIVTAVFLPESPEFLYSKGRFEETTQVIHKIARTNSVRLSSSSLNLSGASFDDADKPIKKVPSQFHPSRNAFGKSLHI